MPTLSNTVFARAAESQMHLSSATQKNEALRALVKYPMELTDSSIEEIRMLCSNTVIPVKNINLKELVQRLVDHLLTISMSKLPLSIQLRQMKFPMNLN
jgi:hypothetical protein